MLISVDFKDDNEKATLAFSADKEIAETTFEYMEIRRFPSDKLYPSITLLPAGGME